MKTAHWYSRRCDASRRVNQLRQLWSAYDYRVIPGEYGGGFWIEFRAAPTDHWQLWEDDRAARVSPLRLALATSLST